MPSVPRVADTGPTAAELMARYRDDPMSQEEWLRRQWPVDGSGPPDPTANAVFIGPSAIDMRVAAPTDLRSPKEAKLFEKWRNEDSARYNNHWRNPRHAPMSQ